VEVAGYFGHLGGAGGEPNGRFAELVDQEFNGVDKWFNAAKKAARAARLGDGRI
jgi:superoxide dismutase